MKKIVFAFSVLAAFMMSACLPETRNEMLGIPEGTIQLSMENFVSNDTKTAVSGTSVVWVGGESIDFYVGSESTPQSRDVEISGTNAYVSSPSLEATDDIRAYYPTGLATENQTSNTPRVKTPAEYTCSVSSGRQVIALPMVGIAESSATSIKFKHLTAAINVMLKNSVSGTNLYVDSVVVVAGSHYLNLSRVGKSISFGSDNLNMTATTAGATNADKRVKVSFSSPLEVLDGSENTSIQVPIAPIATDDITINVYCHSATTNYVYSHTESSPAIARNEMLTAKVDLKLTANSGHMEEIVEPTYRSINVASASFPIYAQDGDTLYGTMNSSYTSKQCFIPEGATVTLKNLTMTYMTFVSQGSSTINLEGTNSVAAAMGRPAIFVSSGKTLTIQGDGNLTAKGGTNAAAIGCGTATNGYATCGNIVIKGGTIDATGGNGNDAAAIGTGNESGNTCGYITVENTVTKVTAKKGKASSIACIGTGIAGTTCGTVTIGGVTQTVTVSETVYNGVDATSGTTYTYIPSKK